MTLSIITVTWNVKNLAEKLLESLFLHLPGLAFEVIVVDNNSADGTAEALNKKFAKAILASKLKIIANDFNAGFAKANNQGLKAAKGEWILFMNPDMEIFDDSIVKLIASMEKKKQGGLVGAHLVYPDKTTQKTVKNSPNLCDQMLILLKVHHWLSNVSCLKNYLQKDFDYTKEQPVEQIMGAFVLGKRDLMEKVGGWNEDYWLMWEDVDFCKRVRDLGQEILYSPEATVIHYESKSFAQVPSLNKQKRFNKGMLIYFKKHKPFWQFWVLVLLQPISYALAFVSQTLKIKMRPQSRI
jgi:GT2 family glycosyltransferase